MNQMLKQVTNEYQKKTAIISYWEKNKIDIRLENKGV